MSDYGSSAPPPPPPGDGYGAPGAYGGGYGGGAQEHPRGTMILILGILSIVCIYLLGPVAWVMGNTAIREIDANPSAYSNRGMVQAGRICGIIGTVFLALAILWLILVVALGVGSASFSTSP